MPGVLAGIDITGIDVDCGEQDFASKLKGFNWLDYYKKSDRCWD